MEIIERETILDLPIERQKQIAAEDGLPFGEWREKMRKIIEDNSILELLDAPPLTEEEKAAKIKRIQENPDAIYTYRRIWGDDNLTIEEVIDEIQNS